MFGLITNQGGEPLIGAKYRSTAGARMAMERFSFGDTSARRKCDCDSGALRASAGRQLFYPPNRFHIRANAAIRSSLRPNLSPASAVRVGGYCPSYLLCKVRLARPRRRSRARSPPLLCRAQHERAGDTAQRGRGSWGEFLRGRSLFLFLADPADALDG